MAAEKNKSGQKTSNFWEAQEDGREITNSPQIIASTLAWLKNKGSFLTLLHRGYQSGSTVLVDVNREGLVIDKPLDWPGKETRVRILFKDAGKLWNYFSVDLVAAGNSLHGSLPLSLCRLQRRAHFRVEASRNTLTSFTHRGVPFSMIPLKDISAGGMQLCAKRRLPLACEDVITGISISIPEGNSLFDSKDAGELTISIQQGRIVRVGELEGSFSYGVCFTCSHHEEKMLLRYVRQRELILLRKGI